MMKYQMREAFFACTTPYQIIGAISIVKNTKITADLYIFGMFTGYERVAEVIRGQNIFENVYAVDCTDFQFTKKSLALKQILFCRKAVSVFLPDRVAYKTCYTTSRAHVKTLMIHELRRRNPNMDYVLYEDGTGTYRPGTLAIRTSEKRAKLEKLLGWSMMEPEKVHVMAYEPGLVECSPVISIHPVEQMPRIDWQNDGQMIGEVFGVREEDCIHEKVILFDTVRCGDAEMDEHFDACYSLFLKHFGEDNVICKPHPRSVYKSKSGVRVYESSGIPVEALYAMMPDIEDRLLVSCTSTATFTPRLLFGKEPVLIDINNLVQKNASAADCNAILQKLIAMYKDKSRILYPNTMEELQEMIDRLGR